VTLLLWTLITVTPGSGWSWPILVTEEPNTTVTPTELIAIDDENRFHLVWDDYQGDPRIAYKVFLMNGTTIVPDTMISRDVSSSYPTIATSGDSLFAFWRESTPIYYCARSLTDGSEITPATYLLTESTNYKFVNASADSLGRLHVLRSIGNDVYYARWTPIEPVGFNEDFCWKIEGAYIAGVILVDGDRVHMVVGEYTNQTLEYLQCDLDGNITVPLFDFTPDDTDNGRYPGIAIDDQHDFVVVDKVHTISSSEPDRVVLWKLDGETGEVLIDGHVVFEETSEFMLSPQYDLVPSQDNTFYYFLSPENFTVKQLWFCALTTDGNLILGPSIAYDHSDESPEQVSSPEGVTDAEGNLYIIYGQVNSEPELGCYPTFGWFDHNYLGVGGPGASMEGQPLLELSVSNNPFTGTVAITCEGPSLPGQLMVYDISGRVIQTLGNPVGTSFLWDGRVGGGSEVPAGVYMIQGAISGQASSVTVVKL
jgi:hypothetical protein